MLSASQWLRAMRVGGPGCFPLFNTDTAITDGFQPAGNPPYRPFPMLDRLPLFENHDH